MNYDFIGHKPADLVKMDCALQILISLLLHIEMIFIATQKEKKSSGSTSNRITTCVSIS